MSETKSLAERALMRPYGRRACFGAADQGYAKVAAWFLGPKGENGDRLKAMLTESVDEHANFRATHYRASDPPYIDQEIKNMEAYEAAMVKLSACLEQLRQRLHESEPFFSPRYQAHMNWDTVLPGTVGYVTAMLYNQNNCATEGGPATSRMELEVGRQLCSMLGFESVNGDPQDPSFWGHITADGTLANLESMWMSRNLKLYATAIQQMVMKEPDLAAARAIQVELPDKTSKKLEALTAWELLNLDGDVTVGVGPRPGLVARIVDVCFPADTKAGLAQVNGYLAAYQVQNRGLLAFAGDHPEIRRGLCVFVPATKHYSWPKAGTLLGLGDNAVIGIPVNDRCQMIIRKAEEPPGGHVRSLERMLEDCLSNQSSVLEVVAVIGTTEEGAIDDLDAILDLRDQFRRRGLTFNVHCDAAWGGYLASMNRPTVRATARDAQGEFVPRLPLSEHARLQYSRIGKADTATIDPHKAGFVPYPAGSLCYRNKNLRELITFDAAYLHSDAGVNMGIYGVEGSKPGAAAAAVWLAHNAIGLNSDGYGRILGECMFTVKLYYCYWITLTDESDHFRIVPAVPLPPSVDTAAGRISGDAPIKQYIRDHIIGRTNEELAANADAMSVLAQVGPDVLINAFSVNYELGHGWNDDVNLCNTLTTTLFANSFSLVKQEDFGKDIDLILTTSTLDSEHYTIPLQRVLQQLGLSQPQGSYSLDFFINTILQPWPTTGGFIQGLTQAFRSTVNGLLGTVSHNAFALGPVGGHGPYHSGAQPTPFDDEALGREYGGPRRIVVRSGEIVDQITLTYGTTVVRHGGDGGRASAPIEITKDDPISEIYGYYGEWFGAEYLLQLSIKTRSGHVYGPYGSTANCACKRGFKFELVPGTSLLALFGATVAGLEQSGGTSEFVCQLGVRVAYGS